jgi:hypothetical protein
VKFLCVENYEKLVHQADRPWIKFNVGVLEATRAPKFAELPDATKCLLYHLWLMAKVHNNRIPEHWLTREKLNLKSRVTMDEIVRQIVRSGYAFFVDSSGQKIVDSGVDSTVASSVDSRAINKAFDFDKNLEAHQGEDSKPKSKAKAKDLVENFVLLPKHREWAAKNTPSVPIETELEAWRDRMRANGYVVGKLPVRDPQASVLHRHAQRRGVGHLREGRRETNRPIRRAHNSPAEIGVHRFAEGAEVKSEAADALRCKVTEIAPSFTDAAAMFGRRREFLSVPPACDLVRGIQRVSAANSLAADAVRG